MRRALNEGSKSVVTHLRAQRADGVNIAEGEHPAKDEILMLLQVESAQLDIPEELTREAQNFFRQALHHTSIS